MTCSYCLWLQSHFVHVQKAVASHRRLASVIKDPHAMRSELDMDEEQASAIIGKELNTLDQLVGFLCNDGARRARWMHAQGTWTSTRTWSRWHQCKTTLSRLVQGYARQASLRLRWECNQSESVQRHLPKAAFSKGLEKDLHAVAQVKRAFVAATDGVC